MLFSMETKTLTIDRKFLNAEETTNVTLGYFVITKKSYWNL